MKKKILLLFGLFLVVGFSAFATNYARYKAPLLCPGIVADTNFLAFKTAIIDAKDTLTHAFSGGSTNNGSWLVIPLTTNTSGRYKVTIQASTNSNNARLNTVVLPLTTNYENYTIDPANNGPIILNRGWASFQDFSWVVTLQAGVIQYLRITGVVPSGWCFNWNSVVVEEYTMFGELQKAITKATEFLNTVSFYTKMDQTIMENFVSAIETASNFPSGLTDEEYTVATSALAAASTLLQNEVDRAFTVPCIIDIPVQAASNKITTSSISGAQFGDKYVTQITTTSNGSYVVYKVKPALSGLFTPVVSASTNFDTITSMCVMAAKTLALAQAAKVDSSTLTQITRGLIPEGETTSLNSFNDFSLNSIKMLANVEYFIKVYFMSTKTSAANIRLLDFQQTQVYQSWGEMQIDIADDSAYYATYLDLTSVNYAKVSDADRTLFSNALATAKAVQSTETEPVCLAARTTLQNALNTFKSKISTINMVPGKFDLVMFSRKSGTVSVTSSTNKIESTNNGAYVMFKIHARKSGAYTLSARAATNSVGNNPFINFVVLDDSAAVADNALITENNLSIWKGGWNADSTYKHPSQVKLLADKDYFLRISFIATGSWVANVSSISMTLDSIFSAMDILNVHIATAEGVLAMYQDTSKAAYSRASNASRTALAYAITVAKAVPVTATEEAISAAIVAIDEAVAQFKASISSISVISGYVDLSLFTEKAGTITANVSNGIKDTQNASYAIYKIHSNEGGLYLPTATIATNTDSVGVPRVNMLFASSLLEAENAVADTLKSIFIVKGVNGWLSFNYYEFPKVDLVANQDYFMKLTFNTSSGWCASMSSLKFTSDALISVSKPDYLSSMSVFPNPAKTFVNIRVSDQGQYSISIIDLAGKVRLKQVSSKFDSNLNISTLSPGLYFVRKEGAQSAPETVKLVIK